MDPQGRSAIVTGRAGGLGGATVRRLAEIGYGGVIVNAASIAGIEGQTGGETIRLDGALRFPPK